jgi:N-methylhydantoinase A
MLVADLRHDLVQTRLAAHRDLSPGEARALFDPMLAEARRLLDADRVPDERRRIEMRLDMRYVGQSYELPIPIAGFSEAEWEALVPTFHAEHARRFGHNDPRAPVEIVSFGVTATGLIDTPELPRPPQGGAEPPEEARSGSRRAYFEAGDAHKAGWAECPVWRREALLAGNQIVGPAIIEEISATTVLYPGDRAHVDAIGSLIVEMGT